jgi:hypothetical protein
MKGLRVTRACGGAGGGWFFSLVVSSLPAVRFQFQPPRSTRPAPSFRRLQYKRRSRKEKPNMQNKINVYAKWIVIFPLIWLCGCMSPKVLRYDYADYSEVYADSSNRQLLLNLARLSKDEPVYFIQLGSISSQYQFTTSVGFTPSFTRTAPPGNIQASTAGMIPSLVQHTLTLGGSLNAGVMQNPIFQFLPLTGTNLVQALLTPISDKVFLIFYDQGWSAAWVARTMVASVEKQTITNVIMNSITNSITNCEYWVNDPNDPTYPKFLEFCENLRNAQLCHALTVDTTSSNAAVYCNTNAKLTDVVSAVQSAGMSVNCDTSTGRITVKHTEQSPKWVENNVLNSANYLQYETVFANESQSQTNFTYDTQDAHKKLANAQDLANGVLDKSIKLKIRTFEAVMYCAAKQEGYFQQLEKKHLSYTNIIFTNDPYGNCAIVTRTDNSTFKVRPIMMIKYDDNARSHLSKLVEVEYKDEMYSVGDLEGTQSRTVFTMLSYLFAQTAISTQNLPVQQLIQVQ